MLCRLNQWLNMCYVGLARSWRFRWSSPKWDWEVSKKASLAQEQIKGRSKRLLGCLILALEGN